MSLQLDQPENITFPGARLATRTESGSVVIVDERIGVRVTYSVDGHGTVEATRPSSESMLLHAVEIDAMIEQARVMISQ